MRSSSDACASYMPAKLYRRRTIEDARLTATRRCFATMLCLDLCSIIVSTCRVVRYVLVVDVVVLPVVPALTSDRCRLLPGGDRLSHTRERQCVCHTLVLLLAIWRRTPKVGLYKGGQKGEGPPKQVVFHKRVRVCSHTDNEVGEKCSVQTRCNAN